MSDLKGDPLIALLVCDHELEMLGRATPNLLLSGRHATSR